MATHERSVSTTAAPAAVWRVWSDPSTWPTWNPDVRSIKLDGPFATGTTGTMSTRQATHDITLARVDEGRSFTLEAAPIPLTTFEWLEWGNPNIPEQYDYMLSYSPYDNVEVKNYPNMLVLTGLHDSQVQYWEPAKWVAKLRNMKTDNNLLFLHTNMDAGHGGV